VFEVPSDPAGVGRQVDDDVPACDRFGAGLWPAQVVLRRTGNEKVSGRSPAFYEIPDHGLTEKPGPAGYEDLFPLKEAQNNLGTFLKTFI
jgi:hypothetical protein